MAKKKAEHIKKKDIPYGMINMGLIGIGLITLSFGVFNGVSGHSYASRSLPEVVSQHNLDKENGEELKTRLELLQGFGESDLKSSAENGRFIAQLQNTWGTPITDDETKDATEALTLLYAAHKNEDSYDAKTDPDYLKIANKSRLQGLAELFADDAEAIALSQWANGLYNPVAEKDDEAKWTYRSGQSFMDDTQNVIWEFTVGGRTRAFMTAVYDATEGTFTNLRLIRQTNLDLDEIEGSGSTTVEEKDANAGLNVDSDVKPAEKSEKDEVKADEQ